MLASCGQQSGRAVPGLPCELRLPFAHLNLRRNPFGEISAQETAALACVDIDDVVHRLATPGVAIQYVGDKGFGKTTHLLAIRSRLPDAGYVHIPEGQRGRIPTGTPLLIDEAQRLTWGQRRRLFRQSVPLVLGTHTDYSRALRPHRVTETIAVGSRMDAERLCALLNARIQWARRSEGPLPRIRLETARRLRDNYGPNVRGTLHEMYAAFQSLHEVADV